jgi:ribosomal protein S6
MAKNETHTSENAKLYELGFHIISTVAEDKVADAFSNVTGIINKNNGTVVKSAEPKAIKLAYTITKKIGAANERFNTAYFAWIKFEASSEDVESLKAEIDSNENILRYIIVKTVDDDEHSTAKLVGEEDTEEGLEEAEESEMDSEEVIDTSSNDEEAKDEKTEVEESDDSEDKKSEESKDEIDEAIDELVEEK